MAVAHKVRNVCPLQLSNNVCQPPTDSRSRSRAAGNTTWPGQLSEHDVNVWQVLSPEIGWEERLWNDLFFVSGGT